MRESPCSRNSVIHKILSEFLQPFRYFGMARVSPFSIVTLFLGVFGSLFGLSNNSSDACLKDVKGVEVRQA